MTEPIAASLSARRGEPGVSTRSGVDGTIDRSGLPRPLYVTEEQVALIEGWASNAAAHGSFEAWGVLQQTTLWRVSS